MKFWFAVGYAVLIQLLPAHSRDAPPNVVVILTDDQGWGDLSFNGNRNLRTPHLDSIARDGARFEHFYVCAVCAPTRAEFLTGRYYPRTGVSGVSRGEGRLSEDETTIADVFRSAGYVTGCFGKWHNGTQPPLHPNNRGFDEFYGFTSGHWGHYFSPPLDHNGRRVRGNGYLTDDFTDRAIRFIEEHQDGPFFCYVPYNTPHSPMMVSDRFYDRFKDVDPVQRNREPDKEDLMMTRAALAMCENIDWNVGRLLECLRQQGLQDDTIVVFFCDNGPNSWRWNGGMKGRKGAIDEGGLRSPCFIRWPGKVPANTSLKGIASGIDLLPTLTTLCGIRCETSRKIDGVDLSEDLLQGESVQRDERLIYSVRMKQAQTSVRSQRFRLDSEGRLFDIANDAGQRIDVSNRFPAVKKELSQRAREFRTLSRELFAEYADRPFHVGFGESTTLPARDGIPHGTIKRSSKAPNNSFFTNWTSEDDRITWDVEVAKDSRFEVVLWYTCAEANVDSMVQLKAGEQSVSVPVTAPFDPPLYDKPLERVATSHYFVKDFKSLRLGELQLKKGRTVLELTSPSIVGARSVDVHSIDLLRLTH